MEIGPAALFAALALFSAPVYSQADQVKLSADANHFLYRLPAQHPGDYTEWRCFNRFDSSNNAQAIFSYLINNPLSVSGGLFPIGISEMGAVAFTPQGIVNEADIYLPLSFSTAYDKANVKIGQKNAIAAIGPDTSRSPAQTTAGSAGISCISARRPPGTRRAFSMWPPNHGN